MKMDITELLPRFLRADKGCMAIAKGIEAGFAMMTEEIDRAKKLAVTENAIYELTRYPGYGEKPVPEWLVDEIAWSMNVLYQSDEQYYTKIRYIGQEISKKIIGTKRFLESNLALYAGDREYDRIDTDISRMVMAFAPYIGDGESLTPEQERDIIDAVQNIFQSYIPVKLLGRYAEDYTNQPDAYKDRTDLTEIMLPNDNVKTHVGTMKNMFAGCVNLEKCKLDGIVLDTTNGNVSMESAFDGCEKLGYLNIAALNTACVHTVKRAFYGCGNQAGGFVLDMTGCDLGGIRQDGIENVFGNVEKLTIIANGTRNLGEGNIDLSGVKEIHVEGGEELFRMREPSTPGYWSVTVSIESMIDLFTTPGKLEKVANIVMNRGRTLIIKLATIISYNKLLPISDFHFAGIRKNSIYIDENVWSMFSYQQNIKTIHDIGAINWLGINDANGMFSQMPKLETVDLSGCDLRDTKKWAAAFSNCRALQYVNLCGDTVCRPTDINTMFNGCSALEEIDMSNWDMSALTNISNAFTGCTALKKINLAKGAGIGAAHKLTFDLSASPIEFETIYNLRYALAAVTNGSELILKKSVYDEHISVVNAIKDKGWTVTGV